MKSETTIPNPKSKIRLCLTQSNIQHPKSSSPFRNPQSAIPSPYENPTSNIQNLLPPSAFSCLTAVSLIFFTACSTTRPRVVGSYASTLREPQTESQSLIAMSDQEARQQRAGTTKTRQTASSQTIAKQGQIKKQTSTSEEVIQTETTRYQ